MENSFSDKLNYYSLTKTEDLFREFSSSQKGLSEKEAKQRLIKFGPNIISKREEINIFWEFFSHFKSPLVFILLLAALVSAFLGESINAIIIAVMILLSVILDFFEEHSAGRAANKLKETVKTTATVVRNGKEREIKTADICIGDIVVLNAGDLVPADARIISADDLFVDQSALTGESFPVKKTDKKEESSTELDNIVFLGTNVISGSATVLVVRTGKETEFGKIASTLIKPVEKSEFEIGVGKFGFFIAKIVFFLVLFIFFFNIVRHLGDDPAAMERRLLQSFLFAIAIAVGVTPELLPMIMSITMARGSMKMSKKGIIVKRLAAIPSFGSMDVLCTDKTGTLTENKIAVVTYTNIFGEKSEDVLFHAYLNSFYEKGIENPLDEALLRFRKISVAKFKKIDELPFDFNRKMMSIIVEGPEGQLLITKGGPEAIFEHCRFYRFNNEKIPLDAKAQEKGFSHYHELSSQGYRVLAVAVKKIEKAKKEYFKEEETNLELLGFISFLDPPKKGVKEVLKELFDIGIEVKVITGDNELVAQKICNDVGLKVKGVVLGKDIDAIGDEFLKEKVDGITIFARFSPAQKNRVVRALRAENRVVGYLGDGINDAPALKSADVGISVNNAVDVAKESADIVLTKKDLTSLRDGVLEGRKVFGNTMKYIMMGLSSNFGNMFSAAGAIAFLPFLPMLPIQVLLNNFIYDISQVTIPLDNVDKEWIQKPRRWNLQFIKKFMYFFGPISSFFDFTTFFVLFYVFHVSESIFQTGWFMESLATQALVIHFIRTRQLPFIQSTASKYLLLSTILCVAIGWIIPFTFIGKFFKFQPLPPIIIIAIVLIVAVYLIFIEVGKRIFYKRHFF